MLLAQYDAYDELFIDAQESALLLISRYVSLFGKIEHKNGCEIIFFSFLSQNPLETFETFASSYSNFICFVLLK